MQLVQLYRREGNGRWGTDIPLDLYAQVDDTDYERVLRYHATWRHHSAGYACCTKYIGGHSVVVLMHRFILDITDPSIHTDHKDHNRLNNQRQNLVACTQADNNRNPGEYPHSSRYKGVSWYPSRQKWRAFLTNPRFRHVGYFESEEEANEAVTAAQGA